MITPLLIPLTLSVLQLQENPELANYRDPGRNKICWVHSPNFNERPSDAVVDTIVLHHTAGSSLIGTVKWFATTQSQVSAHYTIGKDGSIVQHVNTFFRAWHAGVSEDKFGRKNLNNFSVGIEIVNLGNGQDPWIPEQIEAVRLLVTHLCRHRYKGQIRQITSHEYIATPTGRKNDPINYPWETLLPLSKELNIELVYGKPNPPRSGG